MAGYTLAQIDAAILRILNTGQSSRIGDRNYNRANLDQLRRLRNELATQEGAALGTKPRFSVARMSNRND